MVNFPQTILINHIKGKFSKCGNLKTENVILDQNFKRYLYVVYKNTERERERFKESNENTHT